MIRILSLSAIALLLLFAWRVSSADPQRLAAFESGEVLGGPWAWISGSFAQEHLAPGVVVQADFGPTVELVTLDSELGSWFVKNPDSGADFDRMVTTAQIRAVAASPSMQALALKRMLGDPWRKAIAVGDQVASAKGTLLSIDEVESAAAETLMEGAQPTAPDSAKDVLKLSDGTTIERGAVHDWLPAPRDLIGALMHSPVIVTDPGAGNASIHLGEVTAPWSDPDAGPGFHADPTPLIEETRQALVRRLRAHLADGGLQDQDLSQAQAGAPSIVYKHDGRRHSSLAVSLEEGALVLETERDKPLPSPWSLAPPLIAILLAILLRRPVLALFAGVLGGSWVVHGLQSGTFAGAFAAGTPAVTQNYLHTVMVDRFKFEIILFVVAMLAMVGVMTRAGGVHGLMERIARLARSARRTQFATWLMGLVVFFDDYANTILVGTTMRPLSDRFKVAREKLAYIVDSTAAPVAGLSLFSTWIAFEVSTFSSALPDAEMSIGQGYEVFLRTLPFRFYCIFTLAFVGMVVLTGRDFGPMLKAERRARGGQLLNPGSTPMVGKSATDLAADPNVTPRAGVALWPLITFVGVTLFTILKTGGAFAEDHVNTKEGWAQVLYNGSGSAPLLYGALAGLALAVVLGLLQGVRGGLLSAAWASVRSMGIAILILYLAWMLGEVCADLGTSTYLTVQLGDSISPYVLPVVLFLLAALVAFSTGSSWSTMTILLPLVVGLSFQLGSSIPLGGVALMIMSIGAVLEGAIFGDHCSPISDTTVMSSIASASDHIDHVRTQMPYALLTMVVAILVGYLPCAYWGASLGSWLPYASMGAGLLILLASLYVFGERTDVPETERAA